MIAANTKVYGRKRSRAPGVSAIRRVCEDTCDAGQRIVELTKRAAARLSPGRARLNAHLNTFI